MQKLLGFLDLLGALVLGLVLLKVVSGAWLLLPGFYLMIKALVFVVSSRDVASFVDLVVGVVVLFFAFVNVPTVLLVIALIWIVQKALLSFF